MSGPALLAHKPQKVLFQMEKGSLGSVDLSVMKLAAFGKVRLEGTGFSRPKPLLLLAYITLEGPQDRRKLAEWFWPEGDMQKRLGQLSVVLAQFKKEGVEVFPDKPGINPLPSLVGCDALEFLEALEIGDLAHVVQLYQGSFLHDLGKPLMDLEVSGEILDWVLERREAFAQKAQQAMLRLAEVSLQAGETKEARILAERAFTLPEAPELEPAMLSRLQQVLLQSGSELAGKVEGVVEASLDELPEAARKVFLTLTLQDKTNLTIVRSALGLSLSELSQARETLILSGLIDSNTRVLAAEMAKGWLSEHPSEWMPLLLGLARATPPEEAFSSYREIYQSTHGFGGAGDLLRARRAYCAQAKRLMDELKFAEVVSLLSELRAAERVAEADPDVECCFLEAYALERLGRFKESLELVQSVAEAKHTPNLVALKSVLLWRNGKSAEARTAAEGAVKSGLDWLWARATANNTLGYLAVAEEKFLEGAALFKKAASLYQTAGEKNRWIGSLNNYATALDRVAEAAEEAGKDMLILEKLQSDAEQAYQQTLEVLNQTSPPNDSLMARVLLNLGMLWERREQWSKAESYYLQATLLAEKTGALEVLARLHLNLGVAYLKQDQAGKARSKFAESIDIAAQAGEFLVQGAALRNLAVLDNDPNAMEVALDFLGQSGNHDLLNVVFAEYEGILKGNLEQALSSNNAAEIRQLLSKLSDLYERLENAQKVEKVEDARKALLHMSDTRPHKDLLLALIAKPSEYPRDTRS